MKVKQHSNYTQITSLVTLKPVMKFNTIRHNIYTKVSALKIYIRNKIVRNFWLLSSVENVSFVCLAHTIIGFFAFDTPISKEIFQVIHQFSLPLLSWFPLGFLPTCFLWGLLPFSVWNTVHREEQSNRHS
jgi:hypothetical protein